MFLEPDDLYRLTGIGRGAGGRTRDQLQIEQLRVMGVPFRVNARGRPVVTWAAVNGVQAASTPDRSWRSNILKFG